MSAPEEPPLPQVGGAYVRRPDGSLAPEAAAPGRPATSRRRDPVEGGLQAPVKET